MIRKEITRSKETLGIISDLVEQGIEKICVIMRHSARHFNTNVQQEPFLGLTENGKEYAVEFGKALAQDPRPIFFSSHFGRCIETAYLMDKGHAQKHCSFNGHNTLAQELTPFYIKDMNRAFAAYEKLGNDIFLRAWFDKELSSKIMQDSEETADLVTDFMIKRLHQLEPGQISLCVSHDWNIYPLKEHKLDLPFEEHGRIEFLEGVVLFQRGEEHFIINHQRGAIKL